MARQALLATLPDYGALQRPLNAALAGPQPQAWRTPLPRWAIDRTLIPYHGQPVRDRAAIDRGQAQDGTSPFHASATASVVQHGQRSTGARTGVAQGASLQEVVQRLRRQAASVGVRPRLLLLDRGFSSVAVVRSLPAARVPFVMPVVCQGYGNDSRQNGPLFS